MLKYLYTPFPFVKIEVYIKLRLLFELSGEHELLPRAEVLACLEAFGVQHREFLFEFPLMLIDSDNIGLPTISRISRRLGMTHFISEVFGAVDIDRHNAGDFAKLDILQYILQKQGFCETRGGSAVWNPRRIGDSIGDSARYLEARLPEMLCSPRYLENSNNAIEVLSSGECRMPPSSYVLRVNRGQHKSIDTEQMERELGAVIYGQLSPYGWRVDPKKPDITFKLVYGENKCFLCIVLHEIDKKQFSMRKPHMRPFFHPGVLMPKFARVAVNLSRVGEADTLLDPFCGTGGLLMEGAACGANLIGFDVKRRMVLGGRDNFEYYDVPAFLFIGDAHIIPLKNESIDAVVADPPYGRSAAIVADSQEELYASALSEIFRVLRCGGRAVVLSSLPIDSLVESIPLAVEEEYSYRVHRSLTRHITVMRKS